MALALTAGVAFAQDATVRRPRRPQPPATAPAQTGGADATAGPAVRGPYTLAPPVDAAAAPISPGQPVTPPAVPLLRSAVRSRWSLPPTFSANGGGACRAQCATTRIACLAPATPDETPRCNAQWTSCLSTCDGLGYGRAPAPPSR